MNNDGLKSFKEFVDKHVDQEQAHVYLKEFVDKYADNIKELEESGRSLNESADYLINQYINENRKDPITVMVLLMRVYKINLFQAKELVEKRCNEL